MKFIHAADLHIDSPLRGLEAYEGAPLDQLRGATRDATQNLVRLAIEQAVDFVVIAGDLFDGKWQDMHTGLWTAARFRELEQANIHVFLLQGNHDAASKVRHAITWSANVHVFSVKKPETIRLDELGVALHGQGFAREQTTVDLAADYPAAVDGLFNIGVLHTSLTGSPDHDTYAPTRLSVLASRGYDYWALGHVHARSNPPLQSQPFVAYSGNTQGRHIKETGPKGCLLVTVDEGELTSVEFHATDTLRWQRVEVALKKSDGRAELLSSVATSLEACRDASEGRFAAVRVGVRGPCVVHHQLMRPTERAEIVAEIRNLANTLDGEVWIEKILFDTSAPVDLAQLREGKDLIGQLLQSMQQCVDDPELLNELSKAFQPLADKAGLALSQAGLDLEDPEQLRYWLRQAEGLLISRLLENTG